MPRRSFGSFDACETRYALSVLVSAPRKPDRCIPPSVVLMLFANENRVSWYESLYWSAISTPTSSRSPMIWIGCG